MGYVMDGILGLVVGDALGVPVEFENREDLVENPVLGMEGYGTFDFPAGTWSDDSSMTFCLMDSLLSGYNVTDIMDKFVLWMTKDAYTPHEKTFDMGNATCAALLRYLKGNPPLKCGGREEYDNGNGSLMRILPMVFYQYAKGKKEGLSEEKVIAPIHEVSKLTHAHRRSKIACGLYYFLAEEMIEKKGKTITDGIRNGLERGFTYYNNLLDYKVDLLYYHRLMDLDQFISLKEDEIESSGYVVDTLEAAIWCLANTNSYQESVLKAVNLGDDTDTVGAVTGGLAGIYYGMSAIPEEWVNELAKNSWILKLCEQFQLICDGESKESL